MTLPNRRIAKKPRPDRNITAIQERKPKPNGLCYTSTLLTEKPEATRENQQAKPPEELVYHKQSWYPRAQSRASTNRRRDSKYCGHLTAIYSPRQRALRRNSIPAVRRWSSAASTGDQSIGTRISSEASFGVHARRDSKPSGLRSSVIRATPRS